MSDLPIVNLARQCFDEQVTAPLDLPWADLSTVEDWRAHAMAREWIIEAMVQAAANFHEGLGTKQELDTLTKQHKAIRRGRRVKRQTAEAVDELPIYALRQDPDFIARYLGKRSPKGGRPPKYPVALYLRTMALNVGGMLGSSCPPENREHLNLHQRLCNAWLDAFAPETPPHLKPTYDDYYNAHVWARDERPKVRDYSKDDADFRNWWGSLSREDRDAEKERLRRISEGNRSSE